MQLLTDTMLLIGGITVFLFGLKLVGSNTEKLSGEKVNAVIKKMTRNRLSACGVGAVTTAFAQSSVATNVIAISFVNTGAISLLGACAVVVGTNVGTTMTAQLVSLSFVGNFSVTAIGSLIAFIGFIMSALFKNRVSLLGNVLLGFGLVFIGIKLMSDQADSFKEYEWFQNAFLIKSAPILLLNGFFITAVCQSSSVVTSMLVVLASKGVMTFDCSVYLIMGANIGTCVSVVLLSYRKCAAARRVAWFNVLFNLLGSLVFYFAFVFSGSFLFDLFAKTSPSVARQIANFHTLFNLVSGVFTLVALKPLVRLLEIIVKDGKQENKGKTEKRTVFTAVKSRTV